MMAMSPMYEKFLELKNQHKDKIMFYQLGDFFEVFDDDARKVSHLLDLTLTRRRINDDEFVAMCGVPKHAIEPYVQRLHDLAEDDILIVEREDGKENLKFFSHKPIQEDVLASDKPAQNSELDSSGKSVLDSLSKPRRAIVEKVLQELENGNSIWKQGWLNLQPQNAISHKPYNGVNNFILSFDQMLNEREDPRYCTFKQASDRNWKIKKGSQGIPIEFFRIINVETKKEVTYEDFEEATKGMTFEEAKQWQRDNLQTIMRFSQVYSADDVEGMPPIKAAKVTSEMTDAQNQALDKLMDNWCCEIKYGGPNAYYRPQADYIHIPLKSTFDTDYDFYATAVHEMAHSTGHSTRLGRFNGIAKPSKEEYAKEELRAEISSMFMASSYDLQVSEDHIKNHSAYIKSWHKTIKENPKELFMAIKDATVITNFIDKHAKNLGIDLRLQNAETYVQDDNEQMSVQNARTKEKGETKTWNSLCMNETNCIKKCSKATLFEMPKGSDFEGYQFYHPNKLVKRDSTSKDNMLSFKLSFTDEFAFKLTKGDNCVEISAKDFALQISKALNINQSKGGKAISV
ncbi:MAG: zincin-like metallopeptidase domain-containing protein [Bacillota bacterium]